ncbi:ribonuclease domain-containing protein [Paenarthrobacter sp. NPDC058040]|uniref:ribonuclease domain-containing protein n=1 Tax=unclassified Paenarthrobacter TaxID=2634190 RepID=UPI0036D76D36
MNRSKLLAFAALVIAAVVLVVAMVSGEQRPTTTATPTAAVSAPANPSGLPAVNASQLPKEARQTLSLIAKGGPYPYDRDGVNFGNFEGLLPRKPGGFYKEYTVVTPGESDRGARRIIAGKDGGKYYTADHYESFKFIVEDK